MTKTNMILIGRLENCDLTLDHPEVSRRHAMVRQVGEAYIIEDLDSSNGTFVNAKRIMPRQAVELSHGTVIALGPEISFLFELK